MPPVPSSSVSVLQKATDVKASALRNFTPRDIADASSCLALSWRCRIARKEMSSARKRNISAAVLQDSTVDEL